jgi:class 3 adenylate cyclase/tetratricopeptide (TPR) repeat protein
MCPAKFKPVPIDTSRIALPGGVEELVEMLAQNAHDVWARQRLLEGWSYGRERDDECLRHPCLISYKELPDSEKQYDLNAVVETLKVILKLGYDLVPPANLAAKTRSGSPASSRSQLLDQIGSLNLSSLIGLWHARVPNEWSETLDVYRHLGQRILKLGEPLLAYDVLTEGLMNSRTDVRLRQLLALALVRSGATVRANGVLMKLREEGHNDEETLGILARTHKDLWAQAAAPAERKRQLRLAYKFYAEAYKLNGGYYSGINAATLGLLLGKKDRAGALAREVRQSCLKELDHLPQTDGQRYWPLATLGEAALILRRWSEAEDRYSQAAEIGRGQFAELSSTRRNARLILNHLDRDARDIERCFQIPKVVVFTGHLLDRPDRRTPRFPPQLESAVRDAIRTRLKKVGAGFGFASAACGSDILFLETLIESGGEAHVVLPYDKKQFMKDSVTILPGTNWGARFEQVLKGANEIITASGQRLGDGSMSFEYTNLLLQGLAHMKARQLETQLVPLAVWDQKRIDKRGGTANVVEHWQNLGLNVEMIDLVSILHRECPNLASRNDAPPTVAPKRSREPKGMRTRLMAMLFADAVNFSKLSEQQIPLFMRQFLGRLANLLANSPNAPVLKNTWGDGLYFVFRNVRDAGLLALEMCEDLNRGNWTSRGLPDTLTLRIALHAGPVYSCLDPVLNQMTYTGTHVSRAARIEPVTPPGQVYASQAFAALAAAQGVCEFTCDYVGLTPLAKGYGVFPTFHVRRGDQTK